MPGIWKALGSVSGLEKKRRGRRKGGDRAGLQEAVTGQNAHYIVSMSPYALICV